MRLILVIFLLIAAAQVAAQTETAYVTDTLRLGLHRAADTSDRAFQMLESGQEMTILERNRNYALVRLPEGTQGYVKTAYLVTEKPAKLIVIEAQAEASRLQQELVELQDSFAQPAATIAALEQNLQESNAALTTNERQTTELNKLIDDYATRFEQYKNSLPLRWVGGATVVCLLAGFLGGLWWTDYRSRKRHGGIRIY